MLTFSQKQLPLGSSHLVSVLAFGSAQDSCLLRNLAIIRYTVAKEAFSAPPFLPHKISEKLSCKVYDGTVQQMLRTVTCLGNTVH